MTDTYSGSWWIADHRPDQEQRRVDGTLTVDAEGRATLTTDEFVPLLVEPAGGGWRASTVSATALVVHGRVIGGRKMTLLRVSGNTSVVHVGAVLEDIWLAPGRPEDLADAAVPSTRRSELVPGEDVEFFAGMDVEIEHLGVWSASGSLARVVPRAPQQETVPLLLRNVHAEPTAELPDGTAVALHSRVQLQARPTAGRNLVRAEETIVARITTAQPASLNALLGYVATVRRLVGLAVRRDIGVIAVQLWLSTPGATADQPSLRLRKLFLPVGDPDAPMIDPSRMLFTLAHIDFAELLPRWAQVAHDLRGSVAGLVAAHDTNAMLESRIVGAVTAAEKLFATIHRGQRLRRVPEGDFARLREVVRAALDAYPDLQQYQGFVRGSIQNQPTLRQRLQLLVDDLGEHAVTLFCGEHTVAADRLHDLADDAAAPAGQQDSPVEEPVSDRAEPQAWAWAAAKARNEIAHEGLTTTLDTDAALIMLHTTVALVEILVLRELGVPESVVAELIRNRHHGVPRRIRKHLQPLFTTSQPTGPAPAAPVTEPEQPVLGELVDPGAELDDEAIDPLAAACLEVAGINWHRGWVPWQAVAAAARRSGVTPSATTEYDTLAAALSGTFGPAAPTATAGRKLDADYGYQPRDLFVAINNHCRDSGQPLPVGRWSRHGGPQRVVAVLPDLAVMLAGRHGSGDDLTEDAGKICDTAASAFASADRAILIYLAVHHQADVISWCVTSTR